MKKSLKTQIAFLLRQKGTIATELVIVLLLLANYLKNITMYSDLDISRMYQPMKLLLISYNNLNDRADFTLLFVFLFPILAVLPGGFAYINEQQTGAEFYLKSRLGSRRYLREKVLSVLLSTFLSFMIPFIVDITFTAMTFPMQAAGDLSGFGLYSKEYRMILDNYVFKTLFLTNPLIYALILSFFLALFAALLGTFTFALSYVTSVKYRVLLFIPAFFMLNLTILLENNFSSADGTRYAWYEYFLLFGENKKNPIYVSILILIIMIITISSIILGKIRKESGSGI